MAKRKRRLNFNDIEQLMIRGVGIILLALLLLKLLLSELKTLPTIFR